MLPGVAVILGSMSSVRSAELGAFLRTRRDHVRPQDVDLPSGARRRVPGLRREEVAVLADVGTSWYTWLEQGRDVHPSAQVLDALARALLLRPDERRHLFALADRTDSYRDEPACLLPGSRTRAILEGFAPWPAVLMNERFDSLAWNLPFRFLITDLETLPPEDRNCAWVNFTDERWRAGDVDSEAGLLQIVSKLRAAHGRHPDDPAWDRFLARMRAASPRFGEMWDRNEVARDPERVRGYVNPHVGTLQLAATRLAFETTDTVNLTVYTPGDDLTRERLVMLSAMIADGRVERSTENSAEGTADRHLHIV
jgi:transcriptional regulator with XRE-family HTH domain